MGKSQPGEKRDAGAGLVHETAFTHHLGRREDVNGGQEARAAGGLEL